MEMLNGDANLYFTAYFIVKSQNALFQCKRLSGPFHLTNKHAALSTIVVHHFGRVTIEGGPSDTELETAEQPCVC